MQAALFEQDLFLTKGNVCMNMISGSCLKILPNITSTSHLVCQEIFHKAVVQTELETFLNPKSNR